MAKTKETVKAAAAERLKQLTSTTPTEPPTTRVRRKTSSSKQGKVSETTPPPAEPDFDITWSNFSKIKALHGLTDKETQDVLLKVVGPDPTGTSFWTDYQRRVKQEIALETQTKVAKSSAAPPVEPPVELPAEPVETKRRRLKYLDFTVPPANPASVGVPTEVPPAAPMDDDDGDDFCECEEEEMIDDDDEEVPVHCESRGDDDQDSPSGAAATKTEKPEVVVQRPEPVEPVRVPVLPKDDDPAACAKADLEKELATRPTAVRSGRVVHHNVKRQWDPLEHDDDGENNEDPALRSMLFLTFILP